MATNILKELKQIQANNNIQTQSSGPNQEEQAQQSQAVEKTNQSMEQMFKNYRHMSYNDKSKVLVDQNEIEKIEKNLTKQIENSKKGHHPDPRLFEAIHYRIYKILKQNYLPEFYQKVLQIPTKIYKRQTCPQGIRFHSCGDDLESMSLYQRTTNNINHNYIQGSDGKQQMPDGMNKSEGNNGQQNKNAAKSNQGSFAKLNIIDLIMKKHNGKMHIKSMQQQRGNKKINTMLQVKSQTSASSSTSNIPEVLHGGSTANLI